LDKLHKEEIEFDESDFGLRTLLESDRGYYGTSNERRVKGTWVQYLASRPKKIAMLEILLDLGGQE